MHFAGGCGPVERDLRARFRLEDLRAVRSRSVPGGHAPPACPEVTLHRRARRSRSTGVPGGHAPPACPEVTHHQRARRSRTASVPGGHAPPACPEVTHHQPRCTRPLAKGMTRSTEQRCGGSAADSGKCDQERANRIGISRRASTGFPSRRAGSKRHTRTARSAAVSRIV